MTAVADRERPGADLARPAPRASAVRPSFLARHRRSIYVLAPVLLAAGLANGWNLQGWPGRVNDDEGTYVSEAWAMIVPHHLSQYTYWYDHPPLGWALIALYIWVTHGFQRYPSAVMAGREFMWVLNLVSCVLLYQLARRLRLRRPFAAAAAVIFTLSPLSIYYHRMVFLDNISTMWMLAALVLAASPRRSLAAAVGSGACFATACLSKETAGVALPAVAWVLWQHTDRRTRHYSFAVFATTLLLMLSGYPLFAALRGELFPGPGHVSLLHSLWWQLISRPGSGGLLNTHSATASLARSWLNLDPWSLVGATIATPFAFAVWRLRPAAFGFGLQAAMLLRNGYVPYMYVTAMLPYGALIIAGLLDACWRPYALGPAWQWWRRAARQVGNLLVLTAVVVFSTVVGPAWASALEWQATIHGDAGSLAATAWINHHLSRHVLVVVDDYIWPDVTMHGKATPLWCWKVNGDPWVRKHLLPDGYKSIDYIVLPINSSCSLNSQQLPTLMQALRNSRIIERFADGLVARKVTG